MFPGEARFLSSSPWEGTNLVGRDAFGDDVATPGGLAKLLRALGYEAHSVTSAGGMAGVQIRSPRYAMQVALVEPAGGGRQRWSGALEWVDESGVTAPAETLDRPSWRTRSWPAGSTSCCGAAWGGLRSRGSSSRRRARRCRPPWRQAPPAARPTPRAAA